MQEMKTKKYHRNRKALMSYESRQEIEADVQAFLHQPLPFWCIPSPADLPPSQQNKRGSCICQNTFDIFTPAPTASADTFGYESQREFHPNIIKFRKKWGGVENYAFG